MKITCKDLGRHYNFRWVFRHFSYIFESGKAYAIVGPNGSGKSTLLQLIAGSLSPSEGTIKNEVNEKEIETDDLYKYISIAAPYMELLEEYTIKEIFKFHAHFKAVTDNIGHNTMIEDMGLSAYKNHAISALSSGMKQRVQLALALYADTPLLLLDEPFTNLDTEGIQWYVGLLEKYRNDRITIVCSNRKEEYEAYCDTILDISAFLPEKKTRSFS